MSEAVDVKDWLEKNLFKTTYRGGLGRCGGGWKEEIRKLDISKLAFQGNFKYTDIRSHPKGELITLALESAENRTSMPQSTSFTYNKGWTTSVTTQTTQALKLEAGMTISIPLPGEWNVGGNFKMEVSISETETHTKSVQELWSTTVKVDVPAQRKVTCSFLLRQAEIVARYKFTGRLAGDISFESWCVDPKTGDGISQKNSGSIHHWAQGMPLPKGMRLDNQVLWFDAEGILTGDQGISLNTKWCECPVGTPDNQCCSEGKSIEEGDAAYGISRLGEEQYGQMILQDS